MPTKKHGKDKYDRNIYAQETKEFVHEGLAMHKNIDWNRLNDKEYLESVLNSTKDRD